jgi:phosphoribosylformylglycinamidine cyclo-ligase
MKYQVDVGKVRRIQSGIWDKIKSTFSFRKGYGEALPVFGHYGGLFKCGDDRLVIHTDGVGTKLLVAQEMEKYNTVGIDAIAMSVNDILCVGAEPLVGVDYIGLAKEDPELVSEIMDGLVKGAEESGCAIIGGETAVIPDIIKGGKRPFDLTFTVVGRVRKLVLGNEITKGDVIVGLEAPACTRTATRSQGAPSTPAGGARRCSRLQGYTPARSWRRLTPATCTASRT